MAFIGTIHWHELLQSEAVFVLKDQLLFEDQNAS